MLKRFITQIKANKTIRFFSWPVLTLKNKFRNRKFTFFEELFLNVVQGSLVVEIKDMPGTYEIDIRSRILMRILISKDYEPEIVSLVKKCLNPCKDAINIGANVGIFTILLADLIEKDRKILAVEPTSLAFKYLVDNLKRNNLYHKAILYNGICSNLPGEYHLNTIQGKEEFSSIGKIVSLNNTREKIVQIKVEGETVNNLVSNHNLEPGIMLIDVEGAEMKVLSGAYETIKKHKPIIISELSDNLLTQQGSSSAEVISFLNELGYTVSDIDNQEVKHPFSGNIIAISNH
jgi:FkbM family methyltransferase